MMAGFGVVRFNTQPPEGGWLLPFVISLVTAVSTHSRLKAAGNVPGGFCERAKVSTHSRLKAAGRSAGSKVPLYVVSTHSRLKAAGREKRRQMACV